MIKRIITSRLEKPCVLALSLLLGFSAVTKAQTVFNFPLNEGSPSTSFTNTDQTLVGNFGLFAVDPNNAVSLSTDSPSGQSGDGSVVNTSNRSYLLADTGTDPVLNITNGPITMESWININPNFGGAVEGVVSYGSSYKLGFKGGRLTFTLFGKGDITNTFITPLPVSEWVHIASVWQPGSGVTFYMASNSVFGATSNFVANTNMTARPLQNKYLSIGSEGFVNGLVGSFDRVKIHNAVLTRAELDEDPLNPKPTYANTKVSYDFNEASLPALNSLTPSLPASSGDAQLPITTGPIWTNDAPALTGNTKSLLFDGTQIRAANIPDPGQLISLGPDTTGTNGNYTAQAWVKLPLGFEPTARMIMFQYQGKPAFSFSIDIGRRLHTTTLGLNDCPSGAVVPNDNQWHHVAVVHENGVQMTYYIDGVLLSRLPYVRGVGAQSTFLAMVGASSAGANPFTGSLARLSLTKGALKPAQFDIPNYVPPAPQPIGDITSSLLLHLRMDDTNGLIAVDGTSGHNNGTLVKFPVDNSQWLAGRIGGALRFQTNAIVTNSTLLVISNSPGSFNFATNLVNGKSAFSVAAWVYANSAQPVGAGVIARGFGPEQFALDIQAGGNLRFIVRNASAIPIDAVTLGSNNNLRTTNRWVHVVGTCDGANTTNGLRIYIDGILANVNTNAPVVFNVNHDVTVGSREFNSTSGYSQAFNGLLDDVRVYNRVLSANDVKSLYENLDLQIRPGVGSATLSWASLASNYVVQANTSLSSTNWTDVAGSATVTPNGYFSTKSVPVDANAKFFRLRTP